MEALGHFAVTLSGYLFWPFIAATVVGALIGVISWIQRDGEYGPNYGSAQYSNATWRMWASAQSLAIMWIIYAILAAVPSPDYQIKEVQKIVEKSVDAEYYTAYSECRDIMGSDTFQNGLKDEHIFCDKRALQFVNLQPEVRTITKKEVVTKYRDRPEELRYQRIFNTCMGKDLTENGWSISYDAHEKELAKMTEAEMRNLRIEMCHKNAKEVVAP